MKNIFKILMFVAVLGMFLGSAAAADMIEHDFDGECKVQIPDEGQWMGEQVPFGDGIYSGGISIHYFTNNDLNGESFDDYIDSQQFENEKTDGNLTIYESGNKYVVLTHTDDEFLLIKDGDLEEAKTIALSADFGDDKSEDTDDKPSAAPANAELESQDFHGLFKMDVPKDSDFGDTEDYDKKMTTDSITYEDTINNLTIHYVDDEDFNDQAVKDTVDGLKQQGAEILTDGNLHIISANGVNEVIFHDGPKTIMIASGQLDADILTDMAKSIEIT